METTDETDFSWVGAHVPCFATKGENIQVLKEPKQFFGELLSSASTSKRRVVLAALYLGTGEKERELIETVKRLLETNPDVTVHLLLDYNRGTRRDGPTKDHTSCSLVAPLLAQFAQDDRVKLHLFHSPKLRGLIKKLLPARWNEIVGLQHMKLYIFDDTLMISGANLSETYFTNRQDRYVMVKNCRALADFYAEIVDAVGECSFKVQSIDGCSTSTEVLDDQCHVHPYEGSEEGFMKMFRERIQTVIKKHQGLTQNTKPDTDDTLIYPLVQYGHADVNYENYVLNRTLNRPRQSHIMLASGYFNLTDEYTQPLLTQKDVTVLAASPQANGFWGAHGLSGFIPSMYTYVAACFIAKAIDFGVWQKSVRMLEYTRPSWTFHAKGLWLSHPKTGNTYATFAGSTNYGYRSDHRDLEAQLLIVTRNVDLQKRLKDEQQHLLHYTTNLDKSLLQRADHYVPHWVRFVSRIVRNFF